MVNKTKEEINKVNKTSIQEKIEVQGMYLKKE